MHKAAWMCQRLNALRATCSQQRPGWIVNTPVSLSLCRKFLRRLWQGFSKDLQRAKPTAEMSWLMHCLSVLLSSFTLFPNSLSCTSQDYLPNEQPSPKPLSQDLLSVEPKLRPLHGLTFWWQRETDSKQNKWANLIMLDGDRRYE